MDPYAHRKLYMPRIEGIGDINTGQWLSERGPASTPDRIGYNGIHGLQCLNASGAGAAIQVEGFLRIVVARVLTSKRFLEQIVKKFW